MIVEEPTDPDFDDTYDDEDRERNEPDYYSCSCCNNVQGMPGMGMSCNRCGLFNVMQEEYY